jgi:hypothetical protein
MPLFKPKKLKKKLDLVFLVFYFLKNSNCGKLKNKNTNKKDYLTTQNNFF